MILYIAYFPLDLVMTIIALILSPVLPFFATKDAHLPKWLSWFDTPDNSLDGDAGHLNRHLGSSVWWRRTCWLARNRAYNFSINVTGMTVDPLDRIEMQGDMLTSNRPIHNGYLLIGVPRLGAFQFYYVKQWSETKCLRIKMGWKLLPHELDVPYKAQYVFSFNPLMGLSK